MSYLQIPTRSALNYNYAADVNQLQINFDTTFVDGTRADNDLVVKSTGKVGIGINTPDGTLHVHTGSAGTVTAAAGSDDLAVEVGDNGGISIITPDDKFSNLYFASPSDNLGAFIRWKYNTGVMDIATSKVGAEIAISSGNGTEAIRIDSSQNVGIGTTSPAASAKVEISSTTGALLLPRMTTTQRNALTAVNGMIIYNSTTNQIEGYENSSWVNL